MTPYEGFDPTQLDMIFQEARRQLAFPPLTDEAVAAVLDKGAAPDEEGEAPRILLVFLSKCGVSTQRLEPSSELAEDVRNILGAMLDLPYPLEHVAIWYRDPRRSYRSLLRHAQGLKFALKVTAGAQLGMIEVAVEGPGGRVRDLNRVEPLPTTPRSFERYFSKFHRKRSGWDWLTRAQRDVMRALLAQRAIADGGAFRVEGSLVEPAIGRRIQRRTLAGLETLGLIEPAGAWHSYRLTRVALVAVAAGEGP